MAKKKLIATGIAIQKSSIASNSWSRVIPESDGASKGHTRLIQELDAASKGRTRVIQVSDRDSVDWLPAYQ